MARSTLANALHSFRERVQLLGLKPASALCPKRRGERLEAVAAAASVIMGEDVKISNDSDGNLVMNIKADAAVQPNDSSEDEAAEVLHEWRQMKLSVRNLVKLRRRCVTAVPLVDVEHPFRTLCYCMLTCSAHH